MGVQKKVKTIPATLTRFTASPITEQKKRKVAGYARVSTDHDDQFSSYEAQIDYYTNYIKGRDDWEFVEVYTDEGITGTSTKHREGFKQMIADALDGKIDLIVTKSVSRFARNTVDSLTTIRQLKEAGVEVYFEKENIWTFDGKGELLLTIMSSLAQEESRSISENCTGGQRKRFADGKVSVPFQRFLGYDRGPDGNLVVNREQAVIVKRIYSLFMQGMTYHGIADTLTKDGIPTPGGKKKWSISTVKSILSNEKYKGDALLQKSYTVDFLTKKTKVNEGEIPQYYVEDNHEAIIDPEVFEMVQREMAKRGKGKKYHSGVHAFSTKIKCGECGSWYGSKVWHSSDKYRRTIWHCNSKFGNQEKCSTPTLQTETIQQMFIIAYNRLMSNRKQILEDCELMRRSLTDFDTLDARIEQLTEEAKMVEELVRAVVKENASTAQSQEAYLKRYETLTLQYEVVTGDLERLQKERIFRSQQDKSMALFIRTFKRQPEVLTDWDDTVWTMMVEKAIVHRDGRITFVFYNGTEIAVESKAA